MTGHLAALASVYLLLAIVLGSVIRSILVAVIALWSLRADEPSRKHALAVLKLLLPAGWLRRKPET